MFAKTYQRPETRVPWISVALISGAALGYEVLLTRLFAIIQWHHFAYMIISLALLGYGVSGILMTLLGPRLTERYTAIFVTNALLFGISSVACFLVAQQVPLNPFEFAWDRRQIWYLLTVYLLLAIPFFGAANCIALTLWRFSRQIHGIYAVDLLGAGVGAIGVVLVLFLLEPQNALLSIGLLGVLAAVFAARFETLSWIKPILILGCTGLILAASVSPLNWLTLRLSEFKPLSQSLAVSGARVIDRRSSPLGLITLVENNQVPFRFAPGMSLAATVEPPKQLGLFMDGDGLGAVTRFDGTKPPDYLAFLTSALPYHLLHRPEVLVLGSGGGSGVLQALLFGAQQVHAVEMNPQLVDLLQTDLASFSGNLFNRNDVRVHLAEARAFVDTTESRFDLIQLDLLDAFGASAAGLGAQSESYLYTIEAFDTYLKRLRAGGILAVTRWLRLPPRDSLRLVSTVLESLRRAGVSQPDRRFALIRGWKTTTLVVRNGVLDERDVAAITKFCKKMSFDLVYYPGIRNDKANKYNKLEQPVFYEGIQALLSGDRAEYIDRYKFDLTPATDDRPYFFRFSKWAHLPELLGMPASAGLAHLDWGYWVVVATLIQALAASTLLILVPLWRRKALGPEISRTHLAKTLAFFSFIGMAFMFVEIAFIQKFTLFLGHPLYAVSIVLTGFLVFAGMGSLISGRLKTRFSERITRRQGPILVWVLILGALATAYLFVLPAVFGFFATADSLFKALLSLGLIAPLAFTMGVPFPTGLARVSQWEGRLIPWAWGINGFTSVIAAVLATLLAMEIGFSGLVVSAILLYLGAAWVLIERPGPAPS